MHIDLLRGRHAQSGAGDRFPDQIGEGVDVDHQPFDLIHGGNQCRSLEVRPVHADVVLHGLLGNDAKAFLLEGGQDRLQVFARKMAGFAAHVVGLGQKWPVGHDGVDNRLHLGSKPETAQVDRAPLPGNRLAAGDDFVADEGDQDVVRAATHDLLVGRSGNGAAQCGHLRLNRLRTITCVLDNHGHALGVEVDFHHRQFLADSSCRRHDLCRCQSAREGEQGQGQTSLTGKRCQGRTPFVHDLVLSLMTKNNPSELPPDIWGPPRRTI